MTGKAASALAALFLTLSCSLLPSDSGHVGYFAPILSPEGDAVLYIKRETAGAIFGAGWEHFSPPAHTHVKRDRFSLSRIDLSSGMETVERKWPASPLEGTKIRTYRGRAFTIPRVYLRYADDGTLEYEIAVSIPSQPRSTTWRIFRHADGRGTETWEAGTPSFSGYRMDQLRGTEEVMALPGEESFPAGIILFDHAAGSQRVVAAGPAYRKVYPEGVPVRVIAERSHRGEIEGIRDMERAHEETLKGLLDQGLPEGEARLRTIDEMRRLGYYPKPTTITAILLEENLPDGDDGTPLFEISEKEFRVGLFRDIAGAIASPGTETEKGMGQYIRHRDFDTSSKINDYLKGGGRIFRVLHGGKTYEITIRRPGDS